MFSFFKRGKSKDSSSCERNDKDKTKSSPGSSFFNKKSDGKRRDSESNHSKVGPSTSDSGSANINGFVSVNFEDPRLISDNNKVISGAISNCDNLVKSVDDISNNKMGNIDSKPTPDSKQPNNTDNQNKRETISDESVTKTGLNSSVTPSTSKINNTISENNSSPVQKLRTDFFKSDLNRKNDNVKDDCKKISSDVSGVSESATGTATTATVQEVESSICQHRAKKEGTPDSDVVFKTAPNTPILSRLHVASTSVAELPSITEDGNIITRLSESSDNKNNSQQSTETLNKVDCDIVDTSDGSNKKQTEQSDNVAKSLTESVKKINDKILHLDKGSTSLYQNHKEENIPLKPQNIQQLPNKLELSNNIDDKILETMAECSVETNTDAHVHKEVVPFVDSDVDDEDISQETSKSETTYSYSVNQDKSSSYSERNNNNQQSKNISALSDPDLERNPTVVSTEVKCKNISNDCESMKLENEIFKSSKNNINNSDDNLQLQENNERNDNNYENAEPSEETEDEASDSEMEDEDESKIEVNTNNENGRPEEEIKSEVVERGEQVKNETEEKEKVEIIETLAIDDLEAEEKSRNCEKIGYENARAPSEGTSQDENGSNNRLSLTDNNQNLENELPNSGEEEEREDSDEEEDVEEETSEEERDILPTIQDSSTQRQHSPDSENKENLVNIESKADRQIRDLKTELKQSEKEINNLKIQVGDLQREVIVKSSGMERVQAELTAAYKESECVRKKLKKLEEDLDTFKQKNSDLTDELNRKTENENENDYWKVIELENEVKEQSQRIKDLESQITAIRLERDKLSKTLEEMTTLEREEERKLVQETLDEAMADKIAIQEKFEREFEKLRSVNCDREQKMLDDFEWKLREVESACKKRLDDKEQSSKQLIREIEGKLTIAEGKLAQMPHLKQCEQELNQLREKSLEQTRALRTAIRQAEQLQNTEKLLQDEVKHLKSLLEKEKSHLTTVQTIHNREIQEKDRKLQFRLEQQRNELNAEWEEKLKRDSQKIKTELERILRNEKQLAIEEVKQQNEHKLRQLKSTWEKKHEDSAREIAQLKQKLSEKEDEFKKELETVQTASDRDIFVLRRKLDKIDISYQEKIEKMQEKHEKEIERITEEAERKLQQCELNWQAQVGSSRTTIELVKEQMHRETQEQLQDLSERHRKQLEEQWDQLIQERDETIAMMEQKHRSSMEKLRVELESIYKAKNSRETELMDTLNHLRHELSGKTDTIDDLKSNFNELHENLEVLSTEVNDKTNQLTKVKQTADDKIRQREQQLEELHQGQIMEMNERHQKEVTLWRNNVEELQKKIAELTKKPSDNQSNDMVKRIEELQKLLKEKDQQVANLSREKHLYQLELMNKDSTQVQAQARQRKKGSKGGGGGGGGGGVGNTSGQNTRGGAPSRSSRGGRADNHNTRQSQGSRGNSSHQR